MKSWVREEFPNIPSLESGDPEIAKRFITEPLNKLLTDKLDYVKKLMKAYNINTPQDAIAFVIEKIKYPFWLGRIPTDKHTWNAFNGKACYTITLDYWQAAWETLMTYVLNQRLKGDLGYGDCEDTAVLTTTLLRLLKIPAYVCFGEVWLVNRNGRFLLGGHGWAVAKLEGSWRLIETTLDIPPPYPDGYPEIDLETPPWLIMLMENRLLYKPYLMFNEAEYYECIINKKDTHHHFNSYLHLKRKDKHSHSKVKAIKEAWRRPLIFLIKGRHLGFNPIKSM